MKKTDYFTDDEVKRLLAVVAETKDELLFRIGLETGAKTSGVRSMRLSWLRMDPNNCAVYFEERGMGGRIVTLSPETYRIVSGRYYMDQFDMRHTMEHPHRKGGRKVQDYRLFPISKKTLNRRLQRWVQKAGVERHVHWGMLKHTCIIRLLRKGMHFDEIARTLRLNKRSLYLAYRRFVPSPEEQEEMIEYRI